MTYILIIVSIATGTVNTMVSPLTNATKLEQCETIGKTVTENMRPTVEHVEFICFPNP